MDIVLTGGTGFVGSHMLERLRSEGHKVRVLARDTARAGGLVRGDSHVEIAPGDVVTGAGLERALQGFDALIHLVGIIAEVGGETFDRVHYGGTRNLVEAAKKTGIRRMVHMSALGARADGVSGYQTSKWQAEEEVRRGGIPFTILRPSIIFGPRDGFVTQMVRVMKSAPLVRPVVGHGNYKFQPIYVDNVVDCFVQSLTNEKAENRTIELGGPEQVTLNQILDEIARCVGVRKFPVHVPFWVTYLNAVVLGTIMARPPVTVDQLLMLREGSTCDTGPMLATFRLKLVRFREGLERYLCRPPPAANKK